MRHTDFEPSYSSSSSKADWRAIFKRKFASYSEQGLYLKGLRLREGYTQAQLGVLTGVSRNTISLIERGKTPH